MADPRIPDQPVSGASSDYQPSQAAASEQASKTAAASDTAGSGGSPPQLNFASVIYGTLAVCEELYTTMATTTPQVLLNVLNQQSALLGELTSASEAPGICAASLSVLQAEESQVETMESQTQSAISASNTAAEQVSSMVINFVQTITQLLSAAGQAPNG